MYKSIRELKQEARQALSGKRGLAIGMTIVMSLIVSLFSAEGLLSLIGTLLSVILSVGLSSFYLKLCCNQKAQARFGDLFYGFQCHPGKALLLYLLTILYMLPAIIVYGIGFAIVFFMNAGTLSMGSILFGLVSILLAIGLTVVFFIYAAYVATTYSMVYYLLLDYPDLPVMDIWKRSAQIMKGSRLRFIGLQLSFMPWLLLPLVVMILGVVSHSFVILFLGGLVFLFCTFWVTPYMAASQAEMYLDLIQHHSYRAASAADADEPAKEEETAVFFSDEASQ